MSSMLRSLPTTIDLEDFTDFDCSLRNQTVNYSEIQENSITLFGDRNLAIGLAIKLNLNGSKIRSDDYFTIKGTKTLIVDMVKKIKEQPGYVAHAGSGGVGAAISIGKSLVTPIRVARAFAADTIKLVESGKVVPPPELMEFVKYQKEVKGPGGVSSFVSADALPKKYAFLNAAYGMTDSEIKKNQEGLILFASNFDSMIDSAYKKGWIQGAVNKRSHAESLVNYIQFRGIDLA